MDYLFDFSVCRRFHFFMIWDISKYEFVDIWIGVRIRIGSRIRIRIGIGITIKIYNWVWISYWLDFFPDVCICQSCISRVFVIIIVEGWIIRWIDP